jgi:hypothetical protein
MDRVESADMIANAQHLGFQLEVIAKMLVLLSFLNRPG